MPGDQILGHLARVAPFASLPSDAREELARSATIVALGRGDWFFRKGKPTDACYIVLRGSLDVVDGGDDTGEVLRVLLADSLLGELGILAGSVRSASVRVRRDARLIRIAREDFEQLLSRRDFALAVTAALARELQISSGTRITCEEVHPARGHPLVNQPRHADPRRFCDTKRVACTGEGSWPEIPDPFKTRHGGAAHAPFSVGNAIGFGWSTHWKNVGPMLLVVITIFAAGIAFNIVSNVQLGIGLVFNDGITMIAWTNAYRRLNGKPITPAQ